METDGRKARGAASRQALLEATLSVLERAGPQGVTHRAIAAEAGISTQAVSYHFGTIDELLVSAIQTATSHWPPLVAAAGTGSTARDLATVLVAEAQTNRSRLIAEVELYLLAARRPALREVAFAWANAVIDLFGELDEVSRRSLIAAMDGISLQLIIAEEPLTVEFVTAVLERALPVRAETTG
ncbi:MAG TPA: TetR family transcriptional regulator [Solirubrobacteraceae bacterium]|jgi:DNA-binding transcriptional regulator YbjK|nr:TetR family transcriptional regulator [Solirubrobacteraceae bacterium]